MDTFSTSDLKRLTTAQQGPCVSIFMPTHAVGPDGQQDVLRLKNLLAQAERGLGRPGRACSRQPSSCWSRLRESARRAGFWEKRSLGLAVFVTEGLLNRFRVPLQLDEMVVVNRRFQVKPLLPLIGVERPVLCPGPQSESRAFPRRPAVRHAGSQGRRAAQGHGSVPELRFQRAAFAGPPRPAVSRESSAAVVHSLGGEREPAKDELAQYFRVIDAALRETLRDQRAPLILAGVQYLLPIYREISSYALHRERRSPGQSRSSRGARTAQPHLAADPVPCLRARSAGGGRQVPEAGRHGQDVGRSPPDRARGAAGPDRIPVCRPVGAPLGRL